MTLDPNTAARLSQTGRRADAARDMTVTPARPAPRTKPFRLTVDLPPAIHAQFSRWIIDTEEHLGRNIDKRVVVLSLLDRLFSDSDLAAAIRDQVFVDTASGRQLSS